MTPSDAIYLGNLALSSASWSKTVVVFLIPSVDVETKSKTPTKGFVNKPTKPFPTPLTKPDAPSFSAPSIGLDYRYQLRPSPLRVKLDLRLHPQTRSSHYPQTQKHPPRHHTAHVLACFAFASCVASSDTRYPS